MSRSGITQTHMLRAAAGGAVVIALALGACGDDAPEPTPDYPAAADEICLDVAGQLADERKSEAPSSSPEDAVDLLAAQLPIRRDGLERLQALLAPPELVAASEQYLSAAQDRVDALEDALAAARHEDEDDYLAAQERFERLSDKMRGVGDEVGLEACAEVLPPAGQEDVLAAVEKLLTNQDSKKVCAALLTERFAEDVYGSVEKCETERGLPTAVSLELLDVGGIAATSAFVDVEVVDFFGTSKQQRIELVFVGKVWKVDHRTALEQPASADEPKKGDEPKQNDEGASGESP